MCLTDLKETVQRMHTLREQLLEANQLYKEGNFEAYDEKFNALQPDLLYVTQSLLGVVSLREDKTPYGDPMPVVDSIDLDALNCSLSFDELEEVK